MGCDIHLFIEVRKNGKWEEHDWRNAYINGKYSDGSVAYDYEKLLKNAFYVGRNYDLFAILANVRNGYGFAGCDTGDGFVPIDKPRGLPEDVSDRIKKESDDWDCDGHSHTYMTVQELLDYDWDQTTNQRGIVDIVEYNKFKEKGKPESWCGGTSNKVISNEDMDALLGEIDDKLLKKSHPMIGKFKSSTRVEWKEKYRDSVSYFLKKTLPALKKLGKPEDTRLVFWFDN